MSEETSVCLLSNISTEYLENEDSQRAISNATTYLQSHNIPDMIFLFGTPGGLTFYALLPCNFTRVHLCPGPVKEPSSEQRLLTKKHLQKEMERLNSE